MVDTHKKDECEKVVSVNFYPADFLVGTMHMSNTEVGKYIKALCIIHEHGPQTLNDLERIIGRLSKKILQKFKKNENKYYNARWEKEKKKRKNYVANRSNNLKKGKNTRKTNPHMGGNNLPPYGLGLAYYKDLNNRNGLNPDEQKYLQCFVEIYEKKLQCACPWHPHTAQAVQRVASDSSITLQVWRRALNALFDDYYSVGKRDILYASYNVQALAALQPRHGPTATRYGPSYPKGGEHSKNGTLSKPYEHFPPLSADEKPTEADLAQMKAVLGELSEGGK